MSVPESKNRLPHRSIGLAQSLLLLILAGAGVLAAAMTPRAAVAAAAPEGAATPAGAAQPAGSESGAPAASPAASATSTAAPSGAAVSETPAGSADKPAAQGATTPPLRGAAGPGVAHLSKQRLASLTLPPPAPKVDLNHASLGALQTLPGIDAAAARKIVAARPYTTVEDLARTGLSAAVIAKLAPFAGTGRAKAPPTPAGAPVAGSGVPARPGPPPPQPAPPPGQTAAPPPRGNGAPAAPQLRSV